MKAALQFRPIFHAMEVVSAIENAGEQEYENGGFALTPEGEMYFLNTGQKADQLHMNQRRSSELTNDPTKYSVTDHQTTRLIQYAIAHGATIVRTSFARDGQNNRDIVEYQYDRLTNRGVIKVINTAANGVQHNFNSIKEITRQRSAHLTEVAPSEKVFIFTDVQLQQDKAQLVVRARERRADRLTTQLFQKDNFESHTTKISERVPLRSRGILTQAVDTTGYAIRGVGRDTHEIIKDVSLFIKNKNAQQEAKDRILNLPVVRGARRLFKKDSLVDRRSGGQTERLTLEKIREKPVRMVKVIETRHAEMRKSVAVLLVVSETKVALGAVPLVLAALTKEHPKPIQAVEKSIRRHAEKARKVREVRKVREGRKSSETAQPLQIEKVDSLEKVKERKKKIKRRKVYMRHPAGSRIYTFGEGGERNDRRRRKRGRENGVKKVVLAELLPPITLEKRERRKKRELRRIAKKVQRILEVKGLSKGEKTLWVKVAVAAAEFRKLASQGDALRSKNVLRLIPPMKGTIRSGEESREWDVGIEKRVKRKERIAIAGVQFAWMVWMLIVRKDDKKRTSMFMRHRLALQGDALQKQEETPWVLLSIMWYLAMIREQKVYSIQHTAYRKKKKSNIKSNNLTLTDWHLPNQAIIFAYGS